MPRSTRTGSPRTATYPIDAIHSTMDVHVRVPSDKMYAGSTIPRRAKLAPSAFNVLRLPVESRSFVAPSRAREISIDRGAHTPLSHCYPSPFLFSAPIARRTTIREKGNAENERRSAACVPDLGHVFTTTWPGRVQPAYKRKTIKSHRRSNRVPTRVTRQ